ncbi:DUF3347 domain-containing protein [Parapedobacter koreensis]|uniref:Copper chaperone CopZ n=1 Tax=Parapedobacter koreensis TaxID=332977 RepID=A0A1H7MTE5_9SPHI|nr:DUF3347 domain-containing protein [Parapedobacter koreensis]SEL14542.1 Copper chaperone CopZ [Parapedobacter koreensis]
MNKIGLSTVLLFASVLVQAAQVSPTQTVSVRIAGNCGLCKKTIENSGSKKGEAAVSWDGDTQMATITYDPAVTTPDDVLKRVAYAGYDNERYLAPAEAYAELETCCQYARAPQAAALAGNQPSTESHAHGSTGMAKPIDGVLQAYFALKDALVANKPSEVPALTKALAKQLEGISTPEAKKTSSLTAEVGKAKSIADQRAKFATLSESMYTLTKANLPSDSVYYQHCPMYNQGKGANWLSPEKAIRNPYYGDMMLTCGSVVETIGAGASESHQHE